MFEDMEPKKRWQVAMLAFVVFFMIILAGFSPDVGREMSQREEFSYPDSDVWKASDRAEEKMPEEYWMVFQIVMGDSEDSEDHNALDFEVFRETTDRNDQLRADNDTSQYFDVKFNWQVNQNELSTMWGLPDTVRSIMNNETPVTSVIGYTGSRYEEATQDEFTYVLNALFNFRSEDGSFPYRGMVSPDLCVVTNNTCDKPRDDYNYNCLLYTSPSPRDQRGSRMPSSA